MGKKSNRQLDFTAFNNKKTHRQEIINDNNIPEGPILFNGLVFKDFETLRAINRLLEGLAYAKTVPDEISNAEAVKSGLMSFLDYLNLATNYYANRLNPDEAVFDPVTKLWITGINTLPELTVNGVKQKKSLSEIDLNDRSPEHLLEKERQQSLTEASNYIRRIIKTANTLNQKPTERPRFKLLDREENPIVYEANMMKPNNPGADAMLRQESRKITEDIKSKEDNENMLKPLKYVPIFGGIVSGIDLLRGKGDWTDALNVGLNIAPFAPGAWGNLVSSMGMTSALLGEKAGKMLLLPMITGMTSELALQALTGTTISQLAADLFKSWGWNPTVAEFAGSMAEPGYWVNPLGKGKWTEGFFNTVGGMNAAERTAARQLTPAREAIESGAIKYINLLAPSNWMERNIINPVTKYLGKNAYKALRILSPISFELDKRITTPLLQFKSRNPMNLEPYSLKITDSTGKVIRNEFENSTSGINIKLYDNDRYNNRVFGNILRFNRPLNIYPLNYYTTKENPTARWLNNGLTLAAGTDLAINGDDNSTAMNILDSSVLLRRGLQYGLKKFINTLKDKIRSSNDIFYDIAEKARGRDQRLHYAAYNLYGDSNSYQTISLYSPNLPTADHIKMLRDNGLLDNRSNLLLNPYLRQYARFGNNTRDETLFKFYDRDLKTRYIVRDKSQPLHLSVSNINYDKIPFDNLVNYVKKHDILDLRVEGNKIYKGNELIASKKENGLVDYHSVADIGKELSKDIDIFDYRTKKRYTATINIDENGNAVVPQEYLDILRNNIDFVKNDLFPEANLKVFGSAGTVTDSGFPHATHDVDFYITRKDLDKLKAEGKITEDMRTSPGTYKYQYEHTFMGDKGDIDLNVLEEGSDGMATGLRARELFKQFFPDEYFEALRNAGGDADKVKITKTPQELFDLIDPSVKSIVDSFDVDYLAYGKGKHKLRSWMYLLYADPQKYSLAINLFGKSILGKNARTFPMSVELLADRNTNLEILRQLNVKLSPTELELLVSNPLRMKNLLDTWYITDKTAMRAIQDTWPIPGTNQASKGPDNYIKSATTWIPGEANGTGNGGNALGAGLNTAVGGDSEYPGTLSAFILPYKEYSTDNPLKLILEIDYNMGNYPMAPTLLSSIHSYGEMARKSLDDIYSKYGYDFLGSGNKFGKGWYASGVRNFDPNTDAIGFSLRSWSLRSLLDRINVDDTKLFPNSGYLRWTRPMLVVPDIANTHKMNFKWK